LYKYLILNKFRIPVNASDCGAGVLDEEEEEEEEEDPGMYLLPPIKK
jgi:hypothetical protein